MYNTHIQYLPLIDINTVLSITTALTSWSHCMNIFTHVSRQCWVHKYNLHTWSSSFIFISPLIPFQGRTILYLATKVPSQPSKTIIKLRIRIVHAHSGVIIYFWLFSHVSFVSYSKTHFLYFYFYVTRKNHRYIHTTPTLTTRHYVRTHTFPDLAIISSLRRLSISLMSSPKE